MKKFVIFPIIIIVVLLLIIGLSCSSISVKDESSLFPDFKVQKSFYLTQFPVEFTPVFFIKNSAGEKIYKIHKKIKLIDNEFIIEDIRRKRQYILKENKTSNYGEISYSIWQDNKEIVEIKKQKKHYIFSYNSKFYLIEEKIQKNKAHGIGSILFVIKDNNDKVAYIYKKMRFFTNQYLIVINRENQKITNPIFIVLTIFLDQQLIAQGYKYK